MIVSETFLCSILVRQIICKSETIFQVSFVLCKRIFIIQRINSFLNKSDRSDECNFKLFDHNLRTSIFRSFSCSGIIMHIMSLSTNLICCLTFWQVVRSLIFIILLISIIASSIQSVIAFVETYYGTNLHSLTVFTNSVDPFTSGIRFFQFNLPNTVFLIQLKTFSCSSPVRSTIIVVN